MAYKDLQSFISLLEKKCLLKRIQTEVSYELEITEIADRVSKAEGPALLFENVKGSPYPVLINAMGSYERMALALGVSEINQLERDIRELIDINSYLGVKKAIKAIPKLSRLATVFPIKVPGKGKCQEVIERGDAVDLFKLPVLKCWPEDAGRFFTLPLIFTKDPETGTQNVGMYRLQVFDKNTTGMHWHLHKDGREIYEKYRKLGGKMPVSVALGCDPAITYAATAPLPKMIDEMMFAGYIRKRPIKMVKSITNDIFVPASAEFVLEGYVDVNEDLHLEGPFGDHTGYYSLADYYPAFHVTCITHRKNPVYPTTIVGKPPMEDCYMSKATERAFLPLLQMVFPEIVDLNLPLEGVFHNCAIISIKKRYPGHGKKIMNALWGMGQMMYTKMIIVVDQDTKPQDLNAVWSQILQQCDMNQDLVFSKGPLDALDHASDTAFYGTRLGIDATKKRIEEGKRVPFKEKLFKSNKVENELKQQFAEIVAVNCPELGVFSNCIIVAINKTKSQQVKNLVAKMWQKECCHGAKMIIVVDKEVSPNDLSTVAWKIFNNIDAQRDLTCLDGESVCVMIDATKKGELDGHTRVWPNDIEMSTEIKQLVDSKWREYGI
nr:menaquinone biosynthesis decarboxylase [uncultured Cellulosilyticum sp.]